MVKYQIWHDLEDWFKCSLIFFNLSNSGGNKGSNFSNLEKIDGRTIPADLVSLRSYLWPKKNPETSDRYHRVFLARFQNGRPRILRKMKNGKMINFTIFLTFLGSRNPKKTFFRIWGQGHLLRSSQRSTFWKKYKFGDKISINPSGGVKIISIWFVLIYYYLVIIADFKKIVFGQSTNVTFLSRAVSRGDTYQLWE